VPFENAWYLLLLVPVAAAVAFRLFLRRWLRGHEPTMRFPSTRLLESVPTTVLARASHLPWIVRVTALVLLVFAIARPRRGIETVHDTTHGVDIALCVDVSGSMLRPFAERQDESKFDVTKRVAADFVDRRPDDRIALIPFAKYAYRMVPLTLHHEWVKGQLARLQVRVMDPRQRGRRAEEDEGGLIDSSETAIGTAIAVAANALKSSDAKSRVMVLLTDGQSNYGKLDPVQAADIAKKFGVRIYTIGAGQVGYQRGFFGQRTPVDPVDEKTLRKVADVTGGRFFRATDADSLARIYAEIDELEKTEVESVRFPRYDEHYARLAKPAAVLVWVEIALVLTLLRRSP
jgi:Ca-activated chloride channel family protein